MLDEFEKFAQTVNLPPLPDSDSEDEMVNQQEYEAAINEIERQKKRRAEERSTYERHLKELQERFSANSMNATYQGQNGEQNAQLGASQNPDPVVAVFSNLGIVLEGLNQTISLQNQDRGSHNQSTMIADPSGLIREFHGTETPEQSRAWINEFENMARIHEWNNSVTLSVAKSRIRSVALKWLMSKSSDMKDFASFKSVFEKTFLYKRTMSEKLKVMSARAQTFRETIQEYVLDKIWLCTGLNLSAEEIRDEVAAGLWSKDAANYLLGREITTTDDIMKEIVHFDQIENSRRQRIGERKGNGAVRKTSYGGAAVGDRDRLADVNVSSSTTNRSTTGFTTASKSTQGIPVRKCYKCDSTEHLARDCTNPRKEVKCYFCHNLGHIASRCPSLKGKEVKEIKTEEINIVQSESNENCKDKFIREIQVGEAKLIAQIDMGATVCTMRASAVLNENFKMQSSKSVLGGFGCSEVKSPGIVIETVKMDNLNPKEITFRVVPDTAQTYDVILGRPFTEALDLGYT